MTGTIEIAEIAAAKFRKALTISNLHVRKTTRMDSWNDGEYYFCSFAVHKSRRYHAKMRAFYQTCYDLTVAATAITGSAAFVSLFGDAPTLAKWLTGTIAIASTLELVFGFSKKAELHNRLCRRFTKLAASLEKMPVTTDSLITVRSKRLQIERDEPTEKRLIDLVAYNEESRSRGVSAENLVPISKYQRVFGYVCTFGLTKIDQWWATRE